MAYTSLIEDSDIVQGDSSEIFTFSESTGAILDSNWSASFSVIENYGTSPVITRALPKSTDLKSFIFQILPSESTQLTAGIKYLVGVQISNSAISYNAEIAQFKLKVLPQIVT